MKGQSKESASLIANYTVESGMYDNSACMGTDVLHLKIRVGIVGSA